jgi:Zn-dependent protease with chaperone function
VTSAAVILAAVATGCVVSASALAHARWPRRSPAAAILLWQGLGLGWGLGAVGTLLAIGTGGTGAGVATGAASRLIGLLSGAAGQHGIGVLAALRLVCLAAGLALLAVLVFILLAAAAAVLKARNRQLTLLNLLAHGDPKVPGALVVDHPAAAAYCLPGLRSAIVVSAGTLELLDAHELAAVLAHERAHLRERHDLVLLPFAALLRAFRWAPIARTAQRAVALLVEMHADDRALQHRPARELATALLRVGAASGGVPSGALAVLDPAIECDLAARVIRILRPAPSLSRPARVLAAAAAAAAVVIPVFLLVLPVR